MTSPPRDVRPPRGVVPALALPRAAALRAWARARRPGTRRPASSALSASSLGPSPDSSTIPTGAPSAAWRRCSTTRRGTTSPSRRSRRCVPGSRSPRRSRAARSPRASSKRALRSRDGSPRSPDWAARQARRAPRPAQGRQDAAPRFPRRAPVECEEVETAAGLSIGGELIGRDLPDARARVETVFRRHGYPLARGDVHAARDGRPGRGRRPLGRRTGSAGAHLRRIVYAVTGADSADIESTLRRTRSGPTIGSTTPHRAAEQQLTTRLRALAGTTGRERPPRGRDGRRRARPSAYGRDGSTFPHAL